jgi:secreted trypsin-like serine protease
MSISMFSAMRYLILGCLLMATLEAKHSLKQEKEGQTSQSGDQPKEGVTPTAIRGCGKRPSVSAIVGGVDSIPNSWPWAAAIYETSTSDPNNPKFYCGGTILNKRYIITAAHCIVRTEGRLRADQLSVKVGGHDLKTSGVMYEVSEVTTHENYRTWSRYNDIALIRLAKDLDMTSPAVGPVCVPTLDMDTKDYVGEKVTLVGWGTTSFEGDLSKNLMEVEVPVVSNEECNKNYSTVEGSSVAYPEGINHNFLCAGLPEGGKDSCQLDSGGPLMYPLDGAWYQFGIVSFGYKCAEPGYPGVYTRVSHFLKWIGTHVQEEMY